VSVLNHYLSNLLNRNQASGFFLAFLAIFLNTNAAFGQEAMNFQEKQSGEGRMDFRDREEIFVNPETIEEETPNSTFRIGSADFLISAGYEMAYDSNISLINGGSDDFVQTFSPGVRLTVVDPRVARLTLIADYRPSYLLYLDNDEFNNLAHDLNLAAVYNWELSYLRASHSFSQNQRPREDIGGQIATENWDSELDWRWFISDKSQYQAKLGYNQSALDSGPLFAGNEITRWEHSQWFGYQVYPKLFIGPEFNIQHSESNRGNSFLSEFVRIRLEYDPSVKLSVGAFAGMQFSQFDNGEKASLPNYGGNITWAPLFRTTLGLNFSESEQVSVLNARSQLTRAINLRVVQKLGSSIQISGVVGFRQFSFRGLAVNGQERVDEGWNSGLSGNYRFSWGLSTSLFYNYRLNNSVVVRNDFTNHQGGFRLGYQF
jgi:hypothetical protein